MSIEADANKIAEKIQALGENVVRQMERQLLRNAAKIVAERAKQHAPEDTGALKRGIKVRAGRRSRVRQSMLVVSTVPYATAVEFGTKRSPMQAYIRPARDESKEDVLDSFADDLRDMILRAGT